MIVIVGIFLYIAYPYARYRIDYYMTNSINEKDLDQVYIHPATGISFRYPKTAVVKKWFDTEENSLRIISNVWASPVCDIYINDPERRPTGAPEEQLVYNSLEWQKWRYVRNTGNMFDPHFVYWYTKDEENEVYVTSIVEIEKYCETIVSTIIL